MNVAVIKDKTVINVVVFDDFETAIELFDNDAFPNADSIAILESGYGIGDRYADGVWEKAPAQEPPEYPELPTTGGEQLTAPEVEFVKGLYHGVTSGGID